MVARVAGPSPFRYFAGGFLKACGKNSFEINHLSPQNAFSTVQRVYQETHSSALSQAMVWQTLKCQAAR